MRGDNRLLVKVYSQALTAMHLLKYILEPCFRIPLRGVTLTNHSLPHVMVLYQIGPILATDVPATAPATTLHSPQFNKNQQKGGLEWLRKCRRKESGRLECHCIALPVCTTFPFLKSMEQLKEPGGQTEVSNPLLPSAPWMAQLRSPSSSVK